MTVVTDRPAPAGPDGLPQKARQRAPIRRDIQGLRAVAVLLVMTDHAGLMLFPGGFVGVDVFFVISGFVITGQLLREIEREGTVNLVAFYARRAKRLLPAAALVLVATAIMTWLWVPKIRWETAAGDSIASALYVVNWRLADRSVDYLAQDVPPSVVQQYWSLSVEEQFYLVWPLLLLVAVLVATRLAVSRKLVMLGGLTTIAVLSLLWAGHQAVASPERAYFITTTRMWEFAVGAFVAIVAARADRMPTVLAAVLAWTGLGMILLSGRIIDTSVAWPGYSALVPTIGAGVLIAGGVAAGTRGPVAVLGNRFMLVLGYLSYSLYLWHWPLLVVAREHFGSISLLAGLAIMVFTVVPAWLTYQLVENPLRRSRLITARAPVALGVGLGATLVGVASGLLLLAAVSDARSPSPTGSARGAAALSTSPTHDPAGRVVKRAAAGGITPDPLQAPKDVPDLYAQGCQVSATSSEPTSCAYGSADAATTIAVVGDSKAAQWVPAFQVLARDNDWRIVTYTKSACQFATVATALQGKVYDSCRAWTDNVLDRLTGRDKPDVVVTAGQNDEAVIGRAGGSLKQSKDAMRSALVDTWTRVEDAGVRVVVLADTPQTGREVYACVADHPDDLTACTYDRRRGIVASGAPVQGTAAKQAGVPFVDLTDFICPSAHCPPIIGNVLIYRQGSHLTKTYVKTLAPRLVAALAKAGVHR